MPAQTNTTTQNSTPPNIDVNAPYIPRRPAPLVSISINHPFATAFKKLKNFLTHKQTLFSTTFTIKITPIVAIVSLFGVVGIFGGGITTAFTFGKTVEQKFLSSLPKPTPKVIIITPTPAPVSISRSGTIKATYQFSPADTITPALFNVVPSEAGGLAATDSPKQNTPTPKPTRIPKPALRYILESRGGSITFLITPSTLRLQNYMGLRVLITGSFDSSKNTLTISKPEDIEVLQ